MKKKIILVLLGISVVIIAGIYLWVNRLHADSVTRIISGYFEEAETQGKIEEIKVPYMGRGIPENHPKLPILLYYKGKLFKPIYTEINSEYLKIRENGENLQENVYELDNVSYKRAVAYKQDNKYYLYTFYDEGKSFELLTKGETLQSLLEEVDIYERIVFYKMTIYIDEYGDSEDDAENDKKLKIRCKGEFNKFFREYYMEGYGNQKPVAAYKCSERYRPKRYKEAYIIVNGYLEDADQGVVLSFGSKGVWFSCGSIVSRLYEIDDEQIEDICRYIKDNFELYNWE